MPVLARHRRPLLLATAAALTAAAISACSPAADGSVTGGSGSAPVSGPSAAAGLTPAGGDPSGPPTTAATDPTGGTSHTPASLALLPGMPPYPDPHDVYAADAAGRLAPQVRDAKPMVYVPNGISDTVTLIDPSTYRVVGTLRVGRLPQHVVPSYDLRTLWVTDDLSNDLIAIDPRTAKPIRTVPVDDPYNMYFTPDGRYAMVMAEARQRIDFRDAHTMALHKALTVGCKGVDHGDFTLDGRYFLASCEFAGRLVEVDIARERVVRYVDLPSRSYMPQDIKLSPDGRTFYVADMRLGGVWTVDARTFRLTGHLLTGRGAHGLYVSRDARTLYITNRDEGSVSLLDLRTGRLTGKWRIPPSPNGIPASPDMGNVDASGRVLWLSGRYSSEVYAIDTRTGRLLARIPTGTGPHGLCVWPQPGRYSLGHTGILR